MNAPFFSMSTLSKIEMKSLRREKMHFTVRAKLHSNFALCFFLHRRVTSAHAEMNEVLSTAAWQR